MKSRAAGDGKVAVADEVLLPEAAQGGGGAVDAAEEVAEDADEAGGGDAGGEPGEADHVALDQGALAKEVLAPAHPRVRGDVAQVCRYPWRDEALEQRLVCARLDAQLRGTVQ